METHNAPLTGRLEALAVSPTLKDMVQPAFQVPPDFLIREAKDIFGSDNPLNAIVVAEDDIPLGLVMSIHMDRALSQQYGVSLYHNKPVTQVMDDRALILETNLPVELAAGEAMQRDPLRIYDHLIVVEKERLVGTVSVQEILLTLATLQSQRTADMVEINSRLGQAKETAEMVNRQLRDAYGKLQEADRIKTEFLAMVSHELRTPLTSVLGFAEIVQTRFRESLAPLVRDEDTGGKRAARAIDTNLRVIIEEGTRLTTLINDVLDIAKLEAGKIEWKQESVSMENLIARCAASTRSLFTQAGLDLVRDIQPGLPELFGDSDRIMQVLINLLSNAVKFTPRGTVTVGARLEGASIRVAVRDTGVGIDASDLDKVFDKFRQVGDTLTDKPKGTGLGLPICKQIIEAHKGLIGVESAPGKGSEFWFTLPLNHRSPDAMQDITFMGEALKKPEALARRMLITGRGGHILLVEPDDHIRRPVARALVRFGYQVKASRSGPAAMKVLLGDPPGLLIIPAAPLVVGGVNLHHALKRKKETARIPIMLLSVLGDTASGHIIGLDRFFSNPMNRKDFLGEARQLPSLEDDRKSILVADTDPHRLSTIAQALEGVAPMVFTADSAGNCLETLENCRPDIVVLGHDFNKRHKVMERCRRDMELRDVNFVILGDARTS